MEHFKNDENMTDEQYKASLDDALKKAEIANNAKTAFLFNMSHDIRTPLHALMGFLYMAERNIDNREILVDNIKKMKSAGRQLSEMVDCILELARIESDNFELAMKPFSISAVGTEREIVLVSAMEEKHISYKSQIKNISDMYVIGDRAHITQIIYNIMSNAVKFTQPDGNISYCFEQIEDCEDGRARYKWTISDDGIGMSEEFKEHIFERFSREQNTTMSGVEGTGLGMALAKELLDMMDGEITVKSARGKGTTVSFVIPMVKTDIVRVNAEKLESKEERNVVLKDRKILVVEDNDLNRDMLMDLLTSEGMIAEGAIDGADAADKIISKGPSFYDAILMDIQMPNMDGYSATQVIREVCGNIHIPIVGLSANTFKEDISKAFKSGMDEFLPKPVDVDMLKKILKRVIGQL